MFALCWINRYFFWILLFSCFCLPFTYSNPVNRVSSPLYSKDIHMYVASTYRWQEDKKKKSMAFPHLTAATASRARNRWWMSSKLRCTWCTLPSYSRTRRKEWTARWLYGGALAFWLVWSVIVPLLWRSARLFYTVKHSTEIIPLAKSIYMRLIKYFSLFCFVKKKRVEWILLGI